MSLFDRRARARPLPIRRIHRHLLLADDGLWAWYSMAPVPWAFRSSDRRAALLNAMTVRWTELAGHRVHLRVTSQPIPYEQWARGLDVSSPRRLPDIGSAHGEESWAGFLEASQRMIAASGASQPVVYLGVRLTTKRVAESVLPCLLAEEDEPEAIDRLRRRLGAVTAAVRRDGFNARPVTARGLAWLIHQSLALGVTPVVSALAGDEHEWTAEEMSSFTDPVRLAGLPYDGRLQVSATRHGRVETSHVSVLTIKRLGERQPEAPEMWPWMAYTRKFDFGVEWSATFDVFDGRKIKDAATRTRAIADDQRAHYEEHGRRPPPEVDDVIGDAIRVEAEVNATVKEVRTRLSGVIRLAVTAPSVRELEDRTGELIAGFASEQSIEVVHPIGGQLAMAAEFVPGAPGDVLGGHRRQFPGYFASSAVPNAIATLGDGRGPLLGFTSGYGRTAVRFDPTWGPRHGLSGLGFIAAPPGHGKSYAAGVMAYACVKRGIRTTMYDPTGSVRQLLALRDVAPYARLVDISGAEAGVLCPYALVPDPDADDHLDADGLLDEDSYAMAMAEARAERRDITVDALIGLLPERQETAAIAIESAVAAVDDSVTANPWDVVVELERRHGDRGRAVAAQLRAAAQMKGGVLIFPRGGYHRVPQVHVTDAVLTVVTMQGIDPPQGEPQSRSERIALTVLRLAARLTQRAMYADKRPKLIISDEQGIIGAGSNAFTTFLVRASRDSRRYNACIALLSQNPSDLTSLTTEATNLISWAMIGGMSSVEAAEAGLDVLGVPRGFGYERTVVSLPRGAFLMRDYEGVIDTVEVYGEHLPALDAALSTDPGQAESPGSLMLVAATSEDSEGVA